MSVISNSAEALDRVRALLPSIAEQAISVDENRRTADETVAGLRQAGLFNIVMPKTLGGSELGFADLVRVTAEIGTVCGSSAWVFGVLAGHSWLMCLFPIEAQKEVFKDPDTLVATAFRLNGHVTVEGNGYRLKDGKAGFCSGIDFADWVVIGCAVRHADGSEEPRFFVVPKSDIEIVDDWFTVGMRGSGSRTILIDDTFIPAYRSVSMAEMIQGRSPGAEAHTLPRYRMPFVDIAPFSIIGAPIGVALGAVKRFAEDIGKRMQSWSEEEVAQQSTTLARVAEASADVDAALAIVLEDAARIDHASAPDALTLAERYRIPRNWAYAAQKSRYAVTKVFEASGGSAIYSNTNSVMQRFWRDANSGSQHLAFGWDNHMTNFGRVFAGLQPMAFTLKKK